MWKRNVSILLITLIVAGLTVGIYLLVVNFNKNEKSNNQNSQEVNVKHERSVISQVTTKKSQNNDQEVVNHQNGQHNQLDEVNFVNPASKQLVLSRKTSLIKNSQENNFYSEDQKEITIKKTNKNNVFNSHFSQELLNQALDSIELNRWKHAVALKYKQNQVSVTSNSINDYQIVDFALEPDVFQKLLINQIAKKINFADLKITFAYSRDFKKVKVKTVFKDKTTVSKTLFYQLETKVD